MPEKKCPTYDEVVKAFRENPPQWAQDMANRAKGIEPQAILLPKPKHKYGAKTFTPVDLTDKKKRDQQGRYTRPRA